MKRIAAVILAATLVFALISCSARNDKNNKSSIKKSDIQKSSSEKSNTKSEDAKSNEIKTKDTQKKTATDTKNMIKSEPPDGIYKSYLWYANDEEMCFEFKNGKLSAFNESAPSVKEAVDFTVNNNVITLTKDGQTLVHAGNFLYYNFDGSYYEAKLDKKETFDLNAVADSNDFINFKKDGTCEVGVVSPGGTNEVYGKGKYKREGNVITFTFGDTYPYNVAKKFYFYYNPDEGRIYFNTFKKK